MSDKDCSDCKYFFVDDLFNDAGCRLKHIWFHGLWLFDDFPEATGCDDFVKEEIVNHER